MFEKLPKRVTVYEVGPRDGLQNEARMVSTGERDGRPVAQYASVDGFIKAVGGATAPWNERIYDPEVRIDGNLAIVNKRLTGRQYLVGDRPTIADVSMAAYLYYPAEEFGFDIAKDHPAIGAWLDRMKGLPGWKHPYDLMPGHPLGKG